MSSKPPRFDLAAAMEADLETDALGPRAAWGSPPQSPRDGSSAATSVAPSPDPSVLASDAPSVSSSPRPQVPQDEESDIPTSQTPMRPADNATTVTPSIATPQADATVGAGDAPYGLQDDATSVARTRSSQPPASKRYKQPPSRQEPIRVSAYCSPRVVKQLRMMAVTQDTTIDELMTRALNLLFKTEGLPEIAFDGKPFGTASARSGAERNG